jgi:CheY-like chemotaxis protein
MKGNPNILIIEDDQYNYDLLEVILSGINANVLWAKTASQGLEYFTEKEVDLVLMDIKLPDRNGYDLTREFKQINSEIPIIAQTAFALTGDRERALDAGCDSYISKPIRKAKLLEIVQEHLQ